MRALLIGLSLASMLATPALAVENKRISTSKFLPIGWSEAVSIDSVALPTTSPPPINPVFQHAIIRFYVLSSPTLLQSLHFIRMNDDRPEFDLRILPATHIRIKVFRDTMREEYGELNNWV